jgi:S-adenosylmethionine:tRNA ribosyltransferase-isomerase
MLVTDFDFDLPDELIAQDPPAERGGSRLLVLDKRTGAVRDAMFAGLAEILREGDLLVLNNTRVFPARLLGHRVPSGGAVECLLLRQLPASAIEGRASQSTVDAAPGARTFAPAPSDSLAEGRDGAGTFWEALVHPGQKLKPGSRVQFDDGTVRLHGEVQARHFHGRRTVRLWREDDGTVIDAIDRLGHIPLPPYIKREDRASDHERYQTVYARERGSIAAPTAGLHFTPGLLDRVAARGVERAEITLHVGYGTFKPVRAERVEDHVVDPEMFTVSEQAAAALTRARREGRRIVAVGTTTTRALESVSLDDEGGVRPGAGQTQLFIHPGHRFRIVEGLITNFHLPRSSLLMLVAALAGREPVLHAYRHAVANGYRFYSYGDAMVVI